MALTDIFKKKDQALDQPSEDVIDRAAGDIADVSPSGGGLGGLGGVQLRPPPG